MRVSLLLAAISISCLPVLSSDRAHAQSTRTWVSGVGDDVNPCSRTAPCKTFAGAISKTAAGGEINCLDPGGFGSVTITKSITIDCAGSMGSILACGTNGINVTATPNTIKVTLRNLSINGCSNSGIPGLVGVSFTNGDTVVIENVRIFGFRAGNATAVRVTTNTAAGSNTFIYDSVIADNGTGVSVDPIGGSARAAIHRVELVKNNEGMRVVGGEATASIEDSYAAFNSGHAFVALAGSIVILTNTQASFNGGSGLHSDAGTGIIDASSFYANGAALTSVNGGALLSFQNNTQAANPGSGDTPGPLNPF